MWNFLRNFAWKFGGSDFLRIQKNGSCIETRKFRNAYRCLHSYTYICNIQGARHNYPWPSHVTFYTQIRRRRVWVKIPKSCFLYKGNLGRILYSIRQLLRVARWYIFRPKITI
jgi:hypothetical protein